jgi:hypothetical protein
MPLRPVQPRACLASCPEVIEVSPEHIELPGGLLGLGPVPLPMLPNAAISAAVMCHCQGLPSRADCGHEQSLKGTANGLGAGYIEVRANREVNSLAVGPAFESRSGRIRGQADEARGEHRGSGAAAHPANYFIEGKAVLHAPCLEPIDIHRIGQVPRRLVSQLSIPQAIQLVDHVLPAELLHDDHQALLSARHRRVACVRQVAALRSGWLPVTTLGLSLTGRRSGPSRCS